MKCHYCGKEIRSRNDLRIQSSWRGFGDPYKPFHSNCMREKEKKALFRRSQKVIDESYEFPTAEFVERTAKHLATHLFWSWIVGALLFIGIAWNGIFSRQWQYAAVGMLVAGVVVLVQRRTNARAKRLLQDMQRLR